MHTYTRDVLIRAVLDDAAHITDLHEACDPLSRLHNNPTLTVGDPPVSTVLDIAQRSNVLVSWDMDSWCPTGFYTHGLGTGPVNTGERPLALTEPHSRRIYMLPIQVYGTADRAATTLGHELTHTAGLDLNRHARLNRYKFANYAIEELTAEFGGLLLTHTTDPDAYKASVRYLAFYAVQLTQAHKALTFAYEFAHVSTGFLTGALRYADASEATQILADGVDAANITL